ncbi:3'-5' exoribonuclease [Halorubrum sp. 48-1-W]|uniref:3'-5' exonuclease n=1 Tax=Halorubrum sp. 48-1-W TaxID=2249761 RepID=UPI000DCE0BB0|nr:3'-5' exonuclease [Halorubrum sp. 48-1-W]RAW44047.1 3'-5' exoribonuclease [Halorubrum sp. 48-1-W]
MTDRVMLDIETLGLEPGASVVSIGAVRFDESGVGDTFERSISLTSCQRAGLTIDAETLEWWLAQDGEALDQLSGGDPLARVLEAFSEWYGDADQIWANSPSFDCELLETAYHAVDRDEPWMFYEERDFRTISSLPVAADVEFEGVEHDALDDAVHQAEVVSKTLAGIEEIRARGESA